jgi:outer membrane protein assembly factor BamB
MMVSNSGYVFVNGGLTRFAGEKVNCLVSSNGAVLWQKSDQRSATALYAAADGVYVGYSGVPHVNKYELTAGNVIWSQFLSGRGLGSIYLIEDEIQVSTDPFIFTVLDKMDGKVLRTRRGDDIYISTSIDTIMHGIQSVNSATGDVIWQQFDLDDYLRLNPIFMKDKILLRTGEGYGGSVYALDRATGMILWKTTEENIIGSIALSINNGQVYALTRDGYLISIDTEVGNQKIMAEFSNIPFILNGEKQVGGYEVAFDDSTQMLYVLLGDSRQLFAFQVE